ncbi:hypothetical protein [Streptomyces lichenis]|uniref:Uncharacterized protein n=1 Tax=Streptomyces lichenis TaxID=2306967 RepID=A0ABT0I3M3_9ACTN|nr:hypothetical protein [Streptomyces lichenis]MCK8675909.1 hypothetical protein [Streptomyces lichenis]
MAAPSPDEAGEVGNHKKRGSRGGGHRPSTRTTVLAHLKDLSSTGRTLEGVLAREDVPAKERILALFYPPPTGTDPVRGCPFIDAAAEFPGPQNAVHSYAREQKLLMVRLVTDLVAELGCRQPRHGAGRGALRPVRADSGGGPCG